MTDDNPRDDDDLLRRLEGGDERALTELFTRNRERLRRMIRLRLDRRMHGRIDSSDVLQDTYLEVARRAHDYLAQPDMPPFLWLRFLTGQTLQALHRHHLKVHMRDAGQEVSLRHRTTPQANSVSLAEMLLGRLQNANKVLRLVETETGRTVARLEIPDSCAVAQEGAAFSPDGSRLVVVTNDGPAVHVWDLRAIRNRLAGMGLDWDAPPYPEVEPATPDPLPALIPRPSGGPTRQ
jgi:DNA-directed RNA polymerase specialized sigma24 family protein